MREGANRKPSLLLRSALVRRILLTVVPLCVLAYGAIHLGASARALLDLGRLDREGVREESALVADVHVDRSGAEDEAFVELAARSRTVRVRLARSGEVNRIPERRQQDGTTVLRLREPSVWRTLKFSAYVAFFAGLPSVFATPPMWATVLLAAFGAAVGVPMLRRRPQVLAIGRDGLRFQSAVVNRAFGDDPAERIPVHAFLHAAQLEGPEVEARVRAAVRSRG